MLFFNNLTIRRYIFVEKDSVGQVKVLTFPYCSVTATHDRNNTVGISIGTLCSILAIFENVVSRYMVSKRVDIFEK